MKLKRFLRTAFWCLLIFLIFALIWWGGPELRIGESRPLEPVGWRVGLIALILLIFCIPLLLRAYSYLFERLKMARSDPVVDETLIACRAFLDQTRARAGRRLSWSIPDYLVAGEPEVVEQLIAKWPTVVVWQARIEGAGSAFLSGGRVYLIPEADSWAAWAKLLRWRRGLRGLLCCSDAQTWKNPQQLQAFMEQLHARGDLWRMKARRILPVWFLVASNQASHYPWRPSQSNSPWGVTLPPGRFSDGAWSQLGDRFLRTFDHSLSDPAASPSQNQQWVKLRMQCQHLIADARYVLKRQADRSLKRRIAVRGFHFVWSDESRAHGLSGLLTILFQDNGRASLSLKWRFGKWALVSILGLVATALTIDATWLRLERHERVLRDWSLGVPQLPLLRLLDRGSESTLPEWILALNDVDLFVQDSRSLLGEELPLVGQILSDRIHTVAVHQGLLPLLHKASVLAYKQIKDSPDDRYRYLAFSMMLNAPERANLKLMRGVLADMELTPAQATSVLEHWVRTPARQPTSAEEADLSWKRASLRKIDKYSSEDMVWSAAREQLRPADAEDFSLDRYMGPNAAWFMPVGSVDWFFTHEGVMRGLRASREYYPTWAGEYRWVTGQPEMALTIDAQEAMELRLRTRYVQEATRAWQAWMEKLRLERVNDLPEAVDRASLFASEASPLIPLLDLLERHMPLPPSGQGSLWMRIKTRVASDWARLQYELGWRRSPKPPVPRADPRIPIAQNFALLQTYFGNSSGKSPARDRLLASVKGISDYLGLMNASDQLGTRTPRADVKRRLGAQALRLPSPLRELMLSLAESSDQEVKGEALASLKTQLEGIESFSQCMKSPIYPMDVSANSELAWSEFAEDFGAMGRVSEVWKTYANDPQLLKEISTSVSNSDKKGLSNGQWLQRAVAISKAWFPKPGQALSLRIKPVALSPEIRIVRLLVGETKWSYAHGQIFESNIDWSPDIGVPKVDMEIVAVNGEVTRLSYSGTWSLLRWATQAQQIGIADRSKVLLHFDGSKGSFQLLVSANGMNNPLDRGLYEGLCAASGKAIAGNVPTRGVIPQPGQTELHGLSEPLQPAE